MLGASAATKTLGASMKAREAAITAVPAAAAAGVLMPVPANATEVLAAAAAIEGAAAAHCQEWLKSFAPSGNGFPYFSVREALISPFASEGRVLFLCVQVSPPNLFYGAKTIFKSHHEQAAGAGAHPAPRRSRRLGRARRCRCGARAERARDSGGHGSGGRHRRAATSRSVSTRTPTTRRGFRRIRFRQLAAAYGDYRLRGSTASRYVVRAVVPGRRFESMPARYAPGAQPPGYTKATYRQAAHWTPSSTTIGSWWRRGRRPPTKLSAISVFARCGCPVLPRSEAPNGSSACPSGGPPLHDLRSRGVAW